MNDQINKDLLLKYTLEKDLERAERAQSKTPSAPKTVADTIASIFDGMSEEQLLLYTVNLFFRFMATQSSNYDPATSDIPPPKERESMAMAMGLFARFDTPENEFKPDVARIKNILKTLMQPDTKMTDQYLVLMLFAARLLHDRQGAQWLLGPDARIATSKNEMAEINPQIWMILQDEILEYLSPPQVGDLYIFPMAPKNPGEHLRQKTDINHTYKKTIALFLADKVLQDKKGPLNLEDEAVVNNIMRQYLHQYKIQTHQLKQEKKDQDTASQN